MYNTEFTTGGVKISGFGIVSLKSSFYTLADSFVLVTSESSSEALSTAKSKIKANAECSISIDNELILTGYIDDVIPSYEGAKKVLEIHGRSKAGDMVDSMLVYRNYRNQTLNKIANDLSEPFGIKAVLSCADVAVPFFSIMSGENVSDAIIRLCRINNKVVYSSADGNLIIADKASNQLSSVTLKSGAGGNLIEGKNTMSARGLYSDYILIGQKSLDDKYSLEALTAPTLSKSLGGRFRQKVLVGDYVEDGYLSREIDKAAKVNSTASLTANSWKNAKSRFFAPNSIVSVQDSWLEMNASYLASGIHLLKTPKTGHVTTFSLEAL